MQTVSKNSQNQLTSLLQDQVKTEPPEWSGIRLQSTSKDNYLNLKKFISRRQCSHHAVVELNDIDHFISSVGDVRVNWNGLFGICEKKMSDEEHLWNADYWLDSSRKEGLSFVSVDDNLLVSRGLYRMVLARYALHFREENTLYGVKVSRWSIDWDFYATWLALKDLCAEKHPQYSLFPERKCISETRDGSWRTEEFLLTLRRLDREAGSIRVMSAKETADWLHDLRDDSDTVDTDLNFLKANALAV